MLILILFSSGLIFCGVYSESDCPKSGWFGSRCQYRCRCRSDAVCDVNNGTCPNQDCSPGWFGPACQYVDFANQSTPQSVINDGNDSTCLSQPSDKVTLTLDEAYVLTWIRVHVNNSNYLHKLAVAFKDDSSLPCSNNQSSVVDDQTMDIHCDMQERVQSVTITGSGVPYLCSVYISGGRNVALMGQTNQNSDYEEDGVIYTSDKAVDGNRRGDFKTGGGCSHTDSRKPGNNFWKLYFPIPQNVTRYVLYNRIDDNLGRRLKGFQIWSYNSENKVQFIYKDTSGTYDKAKNKYVVTTEKVVADISNVTIKTAHSENILTLCEVEVYGDSICEERKYGRDCEHKCNCAGDSSCFVSTGGCPSGCAMGFKGESCDDPCGNNMYGQECSSKCSQFCEASNETLTLCDYKTGECLFGCKPGYQRPSCTQVCGSNTYGQECKFHCSQYCEAFNNTLCDHKNGSCLHGCKPGYYGQDCTEELRGIQSTIVTEAITDTATIIGAVVGSLVGIILVIVVIIAIILCQRRRKNSMTNSSRAVMKDVSLESYPVMKTSAGNLNTDLEHGEGLTNVGNGTYYNSADIRSSTEVLLEELAGLMKSRNKKFFQEQFEAIPANQTATMTEGMSAENKHKNRYKNICAYDHSRVHITPNVDKKQGDYINASYVEGYKSDEKFIASQAPTQIILEDFVRMLWEQEVEKVVMLTNLIEDGKQKSERYWPEDDMMTVGEITIRLTTSDVFADYTIRRLQLKKEGKPVQHLTHFHFTSWPDKDIPDTPWGLVDFEQRVAYYPSSKPTVVHCSAGIGRTGTFIALRNVMRQAEETGRMDFFKTVQKLRCDRVNMVQTADQYMFLHRAAQVAMLCIGTTVTLTDIQTRIQKLQSKSKSGQTEMEKEFKAICTACLDNEEEKIYEDTSHTVYENSGNTVNKQTNRFSNVMPKEIYRATLVPEMPEFGTYINAVLVPSFTKVNQQILTQLPLPTTITDFWRLVTQYQVALVVSFQGSLHTTDQTIGDYLPASENQPTTFSVFTIRTEAVTTKTLWQQQKLVVSLDLDKMKNFFTDKSMGKEHHLVHITCTSTDLNPGHLLSITEQIRSLRPRSSNRRVLFMCRNGADNSGLACVLTLLLDRMDSDNHLTIPLIVGAIKAIRNQVIPTLEQYKAVYEVLHLYSESINEYSNMGRSSSETNLDYV